MAIFGELQPHPWLFDEIVFFPPFSDVILGSWRQHYLYHHERSEMNTVFIRPNSSKIDIIL